MQTIQESVLWAGTEESLHEFQAMMKKASELIEARGYGDEDEDETPRLLQVMDNGVALIRISGALNNSSSWINRYMGMTGYPEIREALLAALEDPSVKQIALDISSPGGTVAGLSDTGDLIRKIHTRVKPVHAFTESSMASAAYWLGCCAGRISASRLAVVGSIGVMATHMEKSKMLKDAGIGVTIVRSGPYKALANQYEPLSEEGLKQLKAQVDAASEVFVEHVANMRGRSIDYTRENMAQGREFTAEDAQRVGLIDRVSSFDDWIESITEEKIDQSKNSMDTRGQVVGGYSASASGTRTGDVDMKRKRALTEQEIAAIASGAVLNAGEAEVDESPEALAAAEALATAEAQAEAEALAASEAAAAESSAKTTENVAKTDDGLTVLKAQIRETQDELMEARIENRALAEQVSKFEAMITPMKAIVAKSADNMRIAMGGSAFDMSAMSAEAILSEHVKLDEKFRKKFQVGGVAAVSATEVESTGSVKVDGLTHARMAAVRNQKKG